MVEILIYIRIKHFKIQTLWILTITRNSGELKGRNREGNGAAGEVSNNVNGNEKKHKWDKKAKESDLEERKAERGNKWKETEA